MVLGGGGVRKQNKTKKPLILQFHRGDQYFILNENLLPSEMQMRLCCFECVMSLLSTQRLTPFLCPDYTSLVSGAGNNISQEIEGARALSKHVCLLLLGPLTKCMHCHRVKHHLNTPSFHPGLQTSHLPSLVFID